MLQLIDSHCHLADSAFDPDRDAVLDRARASGLVAIVAIGESLTAADRARTIAQASPGFVFPTAGVHPHDAATFEPQRDLDAIRTHVAAGAVAIGECGLDYFYDHAPREQQRAAFAAQLELAATLRRPVVVHSREAADDTGRMVADAGRAGVVGVMHCFSGPLALARIALDVGWYISFAGVVTFKKWTGDELVRFVPSSRLMIETDAPYLTPVPHRGSRNEPAYVEHTLRHLARVRAEQPEVLAAACTTNAITCFGLAIPGAGT